MVFARRSLYFEPAERNESRHYNKQTFFTFPRFRHKFSLQIVINVS